MGRWLQASLPAVLHLACPAGWRLQYAATAGADYWPPCPLTPPSRQPSLAASTPAYGWHDLATAARVTAPGRQ
jgi:hypothetical protein